MNQLKYEKLISKDEIGFKVQEISELINFDYNKEELSLLVVLKGAVVFACDLSRLLKLPVTLDYIRVKTYRGFSAESKPTEFFCERDLREFGGKNVLIVEDIIDQGETINFLLEKMKSYKVKTLKICSLLYKKSAFSLIHEIDYAGFLVEKDDFVVGYGMDFDEAFRNLPYIAKLERKYR